MPIRLDAILASAASPHRTRVVYFRDCVLGFRVEAANDPTKQEDENKFFRDNRSIALPS